MSCSRAVCKTPTNIARNSAILDFEQLRGLIVALFMPVFFGLSINAPEFFPV
jgi:hypothetical protein